MGFRIDYAVRGRILRASVRGRSTSSLATWIARDIAYEARQKAVQQLLIDVRGLRDRLGTLGLLVLGAWDDRRVAVLDSDDNRHYHPFSEAAAQQRGHELRYFCDATAALRWLHTE